MRSSQWRPGRWPGALLPLVVAACASEPTTIVPPQVDLVIASGDGQFGTVGQLLAQPLRVVVSSSNTGFPQEAVTVVWDVTEGDAAVVGNAATLTDDTGSTEVQLRMGGTLGAVVVQASVAEQPDASASFGVFTVDLPVLDPIAAGSAQAGATITLSGSNFSADSSQNVVLFSGVRGQVLRATTTSLDVQVPRCLPARDVDVRVQLGVVASGERTLTVTGGGQLTTMQVGEVIDVTDPSGLDCFALDGGLGSQYLTVVYSGSTVGAAQHPFELTALGSAGPAAAAAVRVHGGITPGRVAPPNANPTPDPQALLDDRLRAWEARRVRERGGGSGAPALAGGPARVPSVGEMRTFNVLAPSQSEFVEVEATAAFVGSEAAIFVDVAAPAGGFSAQDIQAFTQRFDQVIHPEVTAAFGSASDVDANERVIVLFTPAVNSLTPAGSNGFIGGYFLGTDLLPGEAGSNGGEVFYALVPDPNGQFSDQRSTAGVLSVVPSVLAHEFQHMVNFNERVLIRGAGAVEATWLAEGLAQMAEEVVARAYETLGDGTSAELFRRGTRARARQYLLGPDTVSLVLSGGQGSLTERGAGFLHVLYLEDQAGTGILGRITASTRTGTANVVAEFGGTWPGLLAEWWSAIYLDGPNPETGPLVYPAYDVRGFLGNPYPLQPPMVGPGDLTASGSLWSSSGAYYIVSPATGGSTTLRLGGEAGGASAPQSVLRMRIIRLS